VVFLAHSGETFLHMLCDAMAILNLDSLFRSFILSGCEKDSKEANRLTAAVLALVCAILQELPENAKLIEKIIFHDSIELFALLKHENSKIRLRACLMLRLLVRSFKSKTRKFFFY
jgi:fused-like protein